MSHTSRNLTAPQIVDDPQRLRQEILPKLLRIRWWNRYRLAGLQHEIVHDAAEHSHAIRLVLELQDQTGKTREWTLSGKTYGDASGASAFDNLRALNCYRDRFQHLVTAQALHYDTDLNLLWQEDPNGTNLQQHLTRTRYPDWTLAASASALCELHACALPQAPSITPADDIASLEHGLASIARLYPGLAARCRKLGDRLIDSTPETTVPACLHGDLRAETMLLDRGRIGFIDLDRLCNGSAARDLGAWLAGKAFRQLQYGGESKTSCLREDPLIKNYQRCAPKPVNPSAIDWYTAVALIHRCAQGRVAQRQSGSIELVDGLVGQAETLAGRLRLAA